MCFFNPGAGESRPKILFTTIRPQAGKSGKAAQKFTFSRGRHTIQGADCMSRTDAQERLAEIQKLLQERQAAVKKVDLIDRQIQELAGLCPDKKRKAASLSARDFVRGCGL